MAIVPKDHVLAQRTISMAELCRYPFVTLQKPSIVRHVIDQCCQKHQLLLDLKVECHQISSLSHFVASGMGVTAIPRHFQPLIDLQQCVVIEISEGNVQLNLGIMYKTDTALSNISNQFIELITHYRFQSIVKFKLIGKIKSSSAQHNFTVLVYSCIPLNRLRVGVIKSTIDALFPQYY